MSGGGTLPIGPGIWGFIAFFVLAVALWFLVRNMNARLRRMAYRDREETEADSLTTPGGEHSEEAGVDGPAEGDQPEGNGADGEAPSDGRARS
ncbi:hypothetical protein ACWEOW_23260 [Monashia sp. NPDC004114]